MIRAMPEALPLYSNLDGILPPPYQRAPPAYSETAPIINSPTASNSTDRERIIASLQHRYGWITAISDLAIWTCLFSFNILILYGNNSTSVAAWAAFTVQILQVLLARCCLIHADQIGVAYYGTPSCYILNLFLRASTIVLAVAAAVDLNEYTTGIYATAALSVILQALALAIELTIGSASVICGDV